ncbi:hypothetical protein C0Z18_20180 [Trinickia dabaoshanensis]|uniref:Uncharacterized protein n=1 Tax=Trinickia dabaoshanensis TaxID=564714 RepID=A0A2N7VJS5_9BURK|nr:hypothetical protein [Trinickia dabaoshanensis]PMS17411.1 hypothetical protein C0Z18_20180 [Trinickia dabaoshanensis]
MSEVSETDWNRLDKLKDEEIDTNDVPRLGNEFFSRAKLHAPSEHGAHGERTDGAPAAARHLAIMFKRPTTPR